MKFEEPYSKCDEEEDVIFIVNHFKLIKIVTKCILIYIIVYSDLLIHQDIIPNLILAIKKYSEEETILISIFDIINILLSDNNTSILGNKIDEFKEILQECREKATKDELKTMLNYINNNISNRII